jgi:hypothetical protein
VCRQELDLKRKSHENTIFAVPVAFDRPHVTEASAQDVYVNSSPKATFSQYHTYAWGQQQNPNQIANSFLAQEAKTQIETQMQSKGLKLVQ